MDNVFKIVSSNKFSDSDSPSENFIIRKLPTQQQDTLDKSEEAHNRMQEIADPKWLNILTGVFICLGAIFVAVFFTIAEDMPIKDTFDMVPWMPFVALGLLLVGAGLIVYKRFRTKKAISTEEYSLLDNRVKRVEDMCKSYLSIPDSAKECDILAEAMIKTKSGKEKKSILLPESFNTTVFLFIEDDNLCLSTLCEVFAFPLKFIKSIQKVDKRMTSLGWNKENNYSSAEFKDYKIRENDNGFISFKPYYKIIFESDGKEFYIAIPPYELNNFNVLLNLPVNN